VDKAPFVGIEKADSRKEEQERVRPGAPACEKMLGLSEKEKNGRNEAERPGPNMKSLPKCDSRSHSLEN